MDVFLLGVVSVDVVTDVAGVVGDSVQFAFPVLQPSQIVNGSIRCDRR